MEYQKALKYLEESRFIELLDEIIIIVEGNNEELFRNALFLKRRVVKLESDYSDGLVPRDYYDAKQNQLAMPMMDLIIESLENSNKDHSVYHLSLLAKRMNDSVSMLKGRIIFGNPKKDEISTFLVDRLIVEMEEYINPRNSKIYGINLFRSDCLDFVRRLKARKKEMEKK